MSVFAMVLVPWLDFATSFTGDDTGSMRRKTIIKVFALSIALTIACLVAYSRLFVGRHSLDQVVYGALVGTWIALTAHFVLREPLLEHARNLLSGRDRSFAPKL